jgi:hypothetical protein
VLTDQSVGKSEGVMDNLVCTECGTTYYSAASASMVERGERCDCGGVLRTVGQHDEVQVPVGAPAAGPKNGAAKGRRRFTRD